MRNLLCDTNIISEVMRVSPDYKVNNWFLKIESVFISVVTIDEVYAGLSFLGPHTKKKKWFDAFLVNHCQILSVSKEIAVLSGQMRGQLRRQGIQRSQADMMVAATAKVHHLILATRNTKDFMDCEIELLNPFEL